MWQHRGPWSCRASGLRWTQKQLRDLTATLISQLTERDARITEHEAQLASRDEELKRKQLKIDQLTHEMATLKRWRYRPAQRAARCRAALAAG